MGFDDEGVMVREVGVRVREEGVMVRCQCQVEGVMVRVMVRVG